MGGNRGARARLRPFAIGVLLGLIAVAAFASLAQADGTPDISASVSSSSQLYGEPIEVSIDAANPGGQPYGYNASFRIVIPAGTSYGGGSPVAPTVIKDKPLVGQTTLLFRNVSDLSPGSHRELGFQLAYDQSVWHAGEAIPVKAQAFVNTNARYVPKFNKTTGQPIGPATKSFTGFTPEVTGEQKLNAIKVSAEEPSPEGEILRGVHEDQTVYTLKVENNLVNPTTAAKLDAFLPAGLEFLGCGAPGGAGTDHTTNAIATNPGSPEEYPGSGPIEVETLAGCSTPELVETEELDPDGVGPMPLAVYTHVRWDVGSLTPGQVKSFNYRAAIPIRKNALAFSGGPKPSGVSGSQATNLDNNTGAETTDEESLPTYVTGSGTYQGGTPTATADETILDRSVEDYAVHKSVEAERLEQGQNVKWNLSFETSEYKFVNEGVVTDTLPDGLCPLGPENFTSGNDPADAECDPVGGTEPSSPYTSAVENADGTWTLTWEPAQFTSLQHSAINARFTLSFWSHTRTHYQQNGLPTTPVLSRDKVTNGVTTEAEELARCVAPEATNCENPAAKISHQVADGTKIPDASSAGLVAGAPTLEKFVAQGPGSNCQTATYVKTVPRYHPGDRVCWKLRISFPGTLDTNAQTIADFLPPETVYVPGSDQPFGANNVTATLDASEAAEGVLNWSAESATVPAGGQIFERVIATEVAPVGTVTDGDLQGNLLKFASANTAGESEALRDEANYEIDIPEVSLLKGVEQVVRGGTTVNGPNAKNADHVQVQEGDEVTYRVDLENSGGQATSSEEVWDILPDDYSCADIEVKGISDGGTCLATAPHDHIVWTGVAGLAAKTGQKKLTYTVTVPKDIGPGRTLVNTAGVREFEAETNTGTKFSYTPAENIDPADATEPNAPAAKDPSDVFTAGAVVAKAEVTGVNEAGNNELTQATIGETITYTVSAEVPEGTTLGGTAELTDALNSAVQQAFVPGSATATLNGGALPGGFELNLAGTTPKVVFPADYTNSAGTGVDKVVLSFQVLVTNVGANVRGSALTDQAKLAWVDPSVGAQSASSATLTTTVVEPLISQEKKDDKNPSRVAPGEVVTYTLSTSNSGAANVSTAHEVAISDLVPIGLTPVKAAGEPLADLEEVPGSGGAVWHSGSRTITKTVATIAPGAKSTFTYLAEVDNPAVGGSELTNTVSSTTASLGAAATGRRTGGSGYAASKADTVRLVGALIEKTSTPEKATPGDPLTYHLKVTIPASVNLFDATVVDVLPTGVEFDGYTEEKCLSGCPLVNPINRYKAAVNGTTGKESIAWDLGDIPALGAPQVIEFTYAAHLLATNRVVGGKVVKGNTEVNAATVSSNLTNKGGPFDENVIPTGFDETSGPAKATTTVIEPLPTLDKQIEVGSGGFGNGPVTAHGNDQMSYRLVVTNSGDAPAYDAEVTDLLDPALENVSVVGQPGLSEIVPWEKATHAMTLGIAGPIPAGGSFTIEYTADFVEQGELHDGEAVVNTAKLAKYFGVAEAERNAHAGDPKWEFRQYAGNEDSTEAVLDFPTFGLVKTTGQSGNPDAGIAEINQEFPWRIVASNTSATADAHNVLVGDTLPPNWSYVPGSAKFDGVGGPDPTITPNAGGGELEWAVPLLNAGANVTITFDAKPSLAAATDPGPGVEANVNSAQVIAATDEAGKTEVGGVPYASAPDTAKATLLQPSFEVTKTPDGGPATAGEPSSYTVTVKNTGKGTARNLDVEDVLPVGTAYVAGSATANPSGGFSEASVEAGQPAAGQTTIHWHVATLAENATVEITVPVAIGADVPDGTTLGNVAGVTSDEVTTAVHDEGSLLVGAEADMTVIKTGDATYTAGDEYTWHLEVKNLGPSDAQGVEVTDPLPAGTTFFAATAPCTPSGGEVKCAIGTAPAGFDQGYDVTVKVDPGTTTSPLDNTATVSTTTTEPAGGGEPNTSTFGPTAGPLADVWVKKTAEPALFLKSQETTFTIEVGNRGPSTARAVKLVDPVASEGLEFVSADPACSEAAGTVTCEFGDLVPGATQSVQVKAKGIKDGNWTNTATASTTTPEPSPEAEEDNVSDAEVVVGPVVDLAIVKTGPATVEAGGQITWTLEVTNNGPDPATGVTVTDALPAGVELVAADPGCAAAGGTVTCDLGELAVGASAVRHITVTAPTALADQTIQNVATVKADQGELEHENNSSEAKTTVGPSADLAIVKTGPTTVAVDGDVTWTLVATNNGPSTATGVKVDDTLPGGVELRSASPSQGSCSGSLGCALGTLEKGASARIAVVAHVPASLANTSLKNSVKVSGDQPDPDQGNNSSEVTTTVGPPPATPTAGFNLTLEKKLVGPSKPQLGDVLSYALTVANQGPATARSVKISDRLPAALEYVSASIPGGKCAAKGAVVTCKLGSLAAGQKRTATLKARAIHPGEVKNTAAVSAVGADLVPSDNHDAAVADVGAGGTVLHLVKKRLGDGAVEAGKTVKFRIRVANSGAVAAADVVVCDRLPGAMSFVAVGKAKFVEGDACWTVAALGPGRSRSFTVVARVDRGVGDGKLRNVAEVEADNAPGRTAAAPVQVKSSGPGRGGGVTG